MKEDKVKRRKLIKQIESMGFRLVRSNGPHDIYMLKGEHISVPRQREISSGVVRTVLQKAGRISQ